MPKPKPNKRPDISRIAFKKDAGPIVVALDSDKKTMAVLQPKDFSTGSYGWYCGEAVTVQVGDKLVKARLNLNLIITNSKNG